MTFEKDKIVLPNGMRLVYPKLRIDQGQLTYNTMRGQENTWGGRLTENAVQALSRIIITDAMDKIKRELPEYQIALTVHDEVVIVGPDTNPDETMEHIINCMVVAPDWCKEIPLDAEGGYDKSYSK